MLAARSAAISTMKQDGTIVLALHMWLAAVQRTSIGQDGTTDSSL